MSARSAMGDLDQDGLLRRLDREGVMPVVVLDRAADATAVADALAAGGCTLVEITLRTDAALEAIRALAGHPSIFVGAGTVLNAAQAREAHSAGARFLVAPGLDAATFMEARSLSLPFVPGVATATELQSAWNLGLRLVKLFPASALGGPAAVRALAAVVPDMRFVPTGGIREADLAEYLAVPSVLACGGTWLAAPELVAAANWREITRRAAAATALRRSRPGSP